jgi:hypothetical protein
MLTSQYPIVFAVSIIQYSYFKEQFINPDIIPHLAGIATKLLRHCHNCFLYWLIISYKLLISRSQSPFPFRDIDNTVFLNDDRKLRP